MTLSGPSAAPRTPTSAPVKRQLTGSKEASELPLEIEEKKGKPSRPLEADASMPELEASPRAAPSSSMGRLYPPHYAGVDMIEAHGDEEVDNELIPDDVLEDRSTPTTVEKKVMTHLK